MTALLVLLLAAELPARPLTLYISPQGNDGWSGTRDAPTAAGDDGPFATIERARLAVRVARDADPGSPVKVCIRGGTYFLAQPLAFTPEDSGTPDAPIVYEAFPDECPVLSGGVRITGWTTTPDGAWRVHLTDVAQGNWNFAQLYVNGVSRFFARMPKSGYYVIADTVPPLEAAQDRRADGFRFTPGDIKADWQNISDVEAVIFQGFTTARMRLAAVASAWVQAHYGEIWTAHPCPFGHRLPAGLPSSGNTGPREVRSSSQCFCIYGIK